MSEREQQTTDDPRINMAMRLMADLFGLRGASREIADTDAVNVAVSGAQLRSMLHQIIKRCDDQSPLAIAIRSVRP